LKCSCTILSSAASPSRHYFSTLSHQQYDFRKKKKIIEHKICFFFSISLSLSAETFFNQRTERDIILRWVIPVVLCKYEYIIPHVLVSKICSFRYIGHLVRYRYSCQIVMHLEFSQTIFRKILKYQILLKSVQWEPSCSVRTDGQTDIMKLIVAFSQFCENAEKLQILPTLFMGFVCISQQTAIIT